MSIWEFSFVFNTINDREGSQGGRGLSTGTRGKRIMHHSWVWEGKQAKLIRFFLDDKYVR